MRFFALFALAYAAVPACGQQTPVVRYQDSVVVLADPEPTTQGQSSRSEETLPASSHAALVAEPVSLLRTDSSVDVQMRGPAGVQTDVSIRGGSFEQTLVLLNGLRINDAQTSHFNFDPPIPLMGLAGIDVLHGSGSTLYGSDAIGGAVNLRTLQPAATFLRLRAGGGSYGTQQQAVQAGVVGARSSALLTGERDFSDGFLADRDYRSESLGAEGWQSTRLGVTDVLVAGSDRRFGANQFYGNYPSAERTKGWFLAAAQPFGSKTTLAVAYRRHTDVFSLYRDKPAVYQNNHVATSVQAVLRRNDTFAERVRLFTGLDSNVDAIRSNALGHHGRNRTAGYAQVDLGGRRAFGSAALREEVVGGYGVVSSPGFSGSVWLAKRIKARASVGNGFRLPTFTDKYYSDPATLPNPALRPESAWSYDGGFDWYLTDRLALSATGYTSRQTDAIDYVRASSQAKYQAQNLSNLHLTGAEVSLHAALPRAGRMLLSYTSVTGAQTVLGSLQSRYLYNFPSHNGSAEWTQPFGQVMARLRVGATQRYSRTAYATVDLSIARERGRWRPYLQMTNLSNTGYEEISGVRMQGRALAGGLEVAVSRSRP